MTDELTLAAEFPTPTREDWLELVDKVLKGGDFHKKLVTRTADGLANLYLKGNVGGISDATELTSANWSTARADAVTAGFTGAKGFDFVLPLTGATASSTQVCLDFAKLRDASADATSGVSGNLQCRTIGS